MRHVTALIHPDARLADDVEVGAYSIIGEHVQIAKSKTEDARIIFFMAVILVMDNNTRRCRCGI